MRYDQKKRDAYYGTVAWRRLREAALIRDHYWCARCGRRPAGTVHHIVPVTERPDLAMELNNLQSLCRQCHNQLHPEKGCRGQQPGLPEGVRVMVIK
jgi:5-methylcytosine-specific restriction endonuclease McrA|nr:MAG TPA: HNH endonuclease [Caudoviricetes sp.]